MGPAWFIEVLPRVLVPIFLDYYALLNMPSGQGQVGWELVTRI